MFLALFWHFFARTDGDTVCSKISSAFADNLMKILPLSTSVFVYWILEHHAYNSTMTVICQNVDSLLLDVTGFEF